MSTEHRRPLYAFAVLALACALFVGNGLRSDAIGGVLRADDRTGALLSVLPSAPEVAAPAPAPTPGSTSRLRMMAAPATSSAAPQTSLGALVTAEDSTVKGSELKKATGSHLKSGPTTPEDSGRTERPRSNRGPHGHRSQQGPREQRGDRGHQGQREHRRPGPGKPHSPRQGRAHRQAQSPGNASRAARESRPHSPRDARGHQRGARTVSRPGSAPTPRHQRGKDQQRQQKTGPVRVQDRGRSGTASQRSAGKRSAGKQSDHRQPGRR